MFQAGRVDLAKFVDVLDGAHDYGHYLVSRCPFHDDSRPSFFVYPDTYRCKACGAHGRTEKLLERLKPSYIPAVRAKPFRNPFSKWLREHDLDFVLKTAYQYRPSRYLIGRGVDAETQTRLRLGQLDGWITFPIFDSQGNLVGAVARAGEGNPSEAKYVVPHGQDPNLLYVPSWSQIANQEVVYVTFGIIDAITLNVLGLAAISTTSGKQVQPSAFDQIRKRLVIIPDAGEVKEGLQLSARLGWRGSVARLDYPDHTKDVNDIYRVERDSVAVMKRIEASYELGRCK